MTPEPPSRDIAEILPLLSCPVTGESLYRQGNKLVSKFGEYSYRIDASGIPLFAENLCSPEALIQREHYDKIAQAYTSNLNYPHTTAYMSYLNEELHKVIGTDKIGVCAEICCGNGEAFTLLQDSIRQGIGIDVSTSMLEKGQQNNNNPALWFVQGDATRLPLRDGCFDTAIMLGGIHHVPNRSALFREVFRILRPGGSFIWREPVSDLWLWKLLRAIVYRLSPILDHETERPLTYDETVPLLEESGFILQDWRTCGFIGFCIFMNSDVLFFNRFFRFIPGIVRITRGFTHFDHWCTNLPGMKRAGLQVVGKAQKPGSVLDR